MQIRINGNTRNGLFFVEITGPAEQADRIAATMARTVATLEAPRTTERPAVDGFGPEEAHDFEGDQDDEARADTDDGEGSGFPFVKARDIIAEPMQPPNVPPWPSGESLGHITEKELADMAPWQFRTINGGEFGLTIQRTAAEPATYRLVARAVSSARMLTDDEAERMRLVCHSPADIRRIMRNAPELSDKHRERRALIRGAIKVYRTKLALMSNLRLVGEQEQPF